MTKGEKPVEVHAGVSVLERFERIDTATVADLLEVRGLMAQVLDLAISEKTALGRRIAGWAFTIRGEVTVFEGTDETKLQALDQVPPESVTVWSGGRVEGVCLFGELLARGMRSRGCRAAVVDGGFRDRMSIGQVGFPVFARYVTPIQSRGRWKVNGWQMPVYLPGALNQHVRVNPGDLILADPDGVVVVPKDLVTEILAEAEELAAAEEASREVLDRGKGLQDVLDTFGRL